MSSNFMLFISVVLNVIVHIYCKDIHRKALELQEDKNVGIETLVKGNTQKFIKPKIPMRMRKNFNSHKDFISFKQKYDQLLKRNYLLRRTMSSAQWFDGTECSLRNTVVQLPRASSGFYYPDYITLPRCTGGCPYQPPDIIHCVAKSKTEIKVWAYHFDDTFGRRKRSTRRFTWNEKRSENEIPPLVEVPVIKHTLCECDCIIQPGDCNITTEKYVSESCECKCKNLTGTCNSTIKIKARFGLDNCHPWQRTSERTSQHRAAKYCEINCKLEWDNDYCRCECKADPHPCSNEYKLWSPDTCKCECLSDIKTQCESKNKILDSGTCSCNCPTNIECPPGKEIQKYDCTCV